MILKKFSKKIRMTSSTEYVYQNDYINELKRKDGVTFVISLNRSIFVSMPNFEKLIESPTKITTSDGNRDFYKVGDIWICGHFSDYYYKIMYAGEDKTLRLVQGGTFYLNEKTQVEYFYIIPYHRRDYKFHQPEN